MKPSNICYQLEEIIDACGRNIEGAFGPANARKLDWRRAKRDRLPDHTWTSVHLPGLLASIDASIRNHRFLPTAAILGQAVKDW